MNALGLGALEFQMMADLVPLKRDMDQAKGLIGGSLDGIKGLFAGALGGLAAGLSLAAFTGWIKGAIDAGDATKAFSQKTGIAANDVAGLQLAFKQGGVEGDVLTKSLGKMGIAMVDGNKAFDTLGVKTRNADGSMRAIKDVFYDTADALKGVENITLRNALATDIFTKSGQALLPTLGEGSEGLRKYAELAEKLGMVIDSDTAEAADGFNDTLELLGMTTDGVGRQVAAQLLPTLNSLAGSLLDNVTSGDKMKRAADILAAGLKGLFSVGAIGVEVFNTVGKAIGGVAAAAVAVAQGEFSQAWKILEESGRDTVRGWGDTAKTISDVWTEAGADTVAQAKAMTSAVGGATVATKEQEAASKKLAEEQAKLTKAGQDYLLGLNEQFGALQQEISLGRALTDGEKEQVKLTEQLTKGKITLTAAEEASARAKLAEMDAIRQHRAEVDAYAKTLAAVAQHSAKWADEQGKSTDTLRAGNVALIEENAKLGMTEQAWFARQQAVLLSRAADLEWQAANEGGNWQLEEQARLLRERAKLASDGVVLKEAKAAADEWQKTTESIQNGLSDALMRAFESGKGFLDAFKDTLLNAFKTLILQPMVKNMVGQLSGGLQSVIGMIGGFMGFGGSDMAGIKASNSGSGNAAMGAAGAFSMWAAAAAAIYSQGNSDYDKGFDRYAARDMGVGAGQGTYLASELLSSLGVNDKIADIFGATAAAKILGRAGPRATATGITGDFGMGGFAGQSFTDWKAKGGWFRSDKTGTNTSPLDASLGQQLAESAGAVFRHVGEYAVALGLPVKALADVTTKARIELGTDAEANQKAIEEALSLYGDALVGTFDKQLSEFAASGESAIDTLNRLGGSLTSVNGVFSTLGLHLVDTSLAGGQAASELVALTGGLNAFMSKTQAYLANYYSQGEQSGIGANSILQTLAAAGIDASGFKERADLRALLESLNPNSVNNTMGPVQGSRSPERDQMAALINVADDFAKLTDYMAETGKTLGELAALAPGGAFTADLVNGAAQAQAAQQSAETLVTVNASIVTTGQSTVEAITVLTDRIVGLESALTAALERNARTVSDAITEVQP